MFLLPSWHKNFTSRIVKSPKLYWFDTSLLCYLLQIRKPEDLQFHPLRGAIFENLIIAERFKAAVNQGLLASLYFWKDSSGREVDLVENPERADPERRIWECKSGMTIASEFLKHLVFLGTNKGIPPEQRILVYGGALSQKRSDARVLGWKDAVLGDLRG